MLMERETVEAALNAVRAQDARVPAVGIVLGSGLGGLADTIGDATAIPYAAIPGMPGSTVPGHAGRLVLGEIGGVVCALLQGRAHFYEGHDMATAAFGVRLLRALGVETLIVTNAAGGLNPEYAAGDLMVLRDHIFLPGMAGFHPLRGPNDEAAGPRFPAMVGAYDAALRRMAREEAARLGVRCHEGVYVMVAGPSYETSAELLFLRAIGADAVGMSTCPEVVVARHAGLRVLGIALIANLALADQPDVLTHDAVVAASRRAAASLAAVLAAVVERLPDEK
jgi:purine-nucleoside phosphorylase